MERLTKKTLLFIRQQLATHPMRDCDVDELVDPQLGVITGFQALIDDLERLRQLDLGDTPPAQGVTRRQYAREFLP